MKDIKDIIGFLIFGLLMALFLWFGAMLILVVFILSIFLAVFIILRGYYLRWRYKNTLTEPLNSTSKETNSTIISKNTIIDVEYHDISEKNKE